MSVGVELSKSAIQAQVNGASYVLHTMISKSRHPLTWPNSYLRQHAAFISNGFLYELSQWGKYLWVDSVPVTLCLSDKDDLNLLFSECLKPKVFLSIGPYFPLLL